MQLGLLAELQGDYPTAIGRLSQAIDREDRNWLLYYLRSKIEHEAGERRRARADLDRARELNPLEACLRAKGSEAADEPVDRDQAAAARRRRRRRPPQPQPRRGPAAGAPRA